MQVQSVLTLTSVCAPTALPGDVNFEELARSCDDFNGAQLKAVCVEAGMLALRREAEQARNSGIALSLTRQDLTWGGGGHMEVAVVLPQHAT